MYGFIVENATVVIPDFPMNHLQKQASKQTNKQTKNGRCNYDLATHRQLKMTLPLFLQKWANKWKQESQDNLAVGFCFDLVCSISK
jgi:hypothetical protein